MDRKNYKLNRVFWIVMLIVLVVINAKAQQLTQSSQYMLNRLILNPAVAGSEEKIPVMGTFRRQWVNIKDAPVTQTLSSHAYVGQTIGIGLILFNDASGPTRRSGLNFSAAKHLQVDKGSDTWLSFGLAAKFFQYAFDVDKLKFDRPDDPVIGLAAKSKLTPDAAAGLYLYNKEFYAGISAQHLFQTKVNMLDINNIYDASIERTYFLTAGYNFVFSDYLALEPSVLVKYVKPSPIQVDINAKLTIAEMVWAGVSYRTSDAVVALAGITYDKFSLGYSYDIVLNPLKPYNKGTHELFIALRLDNILSKDDQGKGYGGRYKKNPYYKKKPGRR
ncbi:MAG TPA: type IX secretion system membrane protein PorP/SprF [Cytophagaceae bacterium]